MTTSRDSRLSDLAAWAIVLALMAAVAGGVAWLFHWAASQPTLESSDVVLDIAAAPPPATADDMGQMIRNPAWAVRPTIQYPEAAARAGVEEGRVELTCEAMADGRIGACKTISETPPGHGFAAAADAGMRTARVHPHQIDGVSTDARIHFTTRFVVEPMVVVDRKSRDGRAAPAVTTP